MALPTAYTEAELAAFMHAELGNVGVDLGYATPTDDDLGVYREPVNDTLLAAGLSTITDATDVVALRLYARVQAWRRAARDAAAEINVSGDGRSVSAGDLPGNIRQELEAAIWDAVSAGLYADPNGAILAVFSMEPAHNPYAPRRKRRGRWC